MASPLLVFAMGDMTLPGVALGGMFLALIFGLPIAVVRIWSAKRGYFRVLFESLFMAWIATTLCLFGLWLIGPRD